MNALILKDTCTIWAPVEVNRQATYTSTTIPCQWEERLGAYRTTSGDMSEYALEIICEEDFIKRGDLVSHSTTRQDTYTVVYVDRVFIRGKYHHSEVYAK